MHNNFESKNWDRVVRFVEYWPKELDLAIEFKHTDWFNNPSVSNELMGLLKEYNIPSVLVDIAGRRDLMHIRLTNNEPFIRYVGSNHESDYKLLNDWVKRLKQWKENRLRNIHFFVEYKLGAGYISNKNADIGFKESGDEKSKALGAGFSWTSIDKKTLVLLRAWDQKGRHINTSFGDLSVVRFF